MILQAKIHGTLLALALTAAAVSAQVLPATAPTTPPPPLPAPVKPVAATPHRARIDYAAGVLQVSAADSSLNQILREISRLTGMKITGGVTEERVYGTYGPAVPSVVLASLLSGTGSNMLLIQNSRESPQELVLTPRQGGPTPPSPNAGAAQDDIDRDEEDLPAVLAHHTQRTPPAPTPEAGVPPAALPPAQPAVAETVAPPAGTTTDQSPNGVKTPQQIYDQLMKLQQQKTQTPGSTDPK